PPAISSVEPVRIDLAVLLFTLGVSVLTGLGFGMAPAWQATRPNVTEALKENARTTSGGKSGRRLRSILVIADVAIALALSVSAAVTAHFSLKASLCLNPTRCRPPGTHP